MEREGRQVTAAVWIGGGAVILATVIAVALMALIFTQPSFFGATHTGGLLVRGLVTSLAVSGAGGFWMLAVTKRAWWLLAPLIVCASIAFLLVLVGEMRAMR